MKIPQKVIDKAMEKWLVPFDLYHMLEEDPEGCVDVLDDWFFDQPECSFCDHFQANSLDRYSCGECPLQSGEDSCHATYDVLDYGGYNQTEIGEALHQILVDIENAGK